MKKLKSIWGIMILLATFTSAYAAPTIFTVSYTKTSKDNSLSLKKATLRIARYAGGKLQGTMTVTTDANQSFTLDNPYGLAFAVEVISIIGEPKHLRCHGSSMPGKTHIFIDCHPLFGKKHYY